MGGESCDHLSAKLSSVRRGSTRKGLFPLEGGKQLHDQPRACREVGCPLRDCEAWPRAADCTSEMLGKLTVQTQGILVQSSRGHTAPQDKTEDTQAQKTEAGSLSLHILLDGGRPNRKHSVFIKKQRMYQPAGPAPQLPAAYLPQGTLSLR